LVDESASSVAQATVFRMFDRTVRRMLDDLERYSLRSEAPGESCTITGDSRALELRDDSVDLVITSPPYCTRIDYVVSTKPELLLLGYQGDEIDGLRRENIGAPVIVDKEITPRPVWGAICNEVLQGVNDHESKASRSYYLPLYLQYFRDAEQSLREIQRVLRPGGEAAIVVQSSYYKELEIPLGDIYVEMSRNLGLQADIGRREVVKQHMAHINTKSSEYVKNKVYYEDVVHVEKPAV
jgi:tRNA G10  N-methylase Trm11